jgi:hypothetical protein
MRAQPAMTPDPPPPSSDNGKQLSPRHRPTLGNLSKDTTELDLWAFEDDLESPESTVVDPQRGTSGAIPAPRERRIVKSREVASKEEASTETGGERIKMNVGRSRLQPQPAPLITPQSPESEFDDLENWEDVPKEELLDDLSDEPAPILLTPEPPAPQPASIKMADAGKPSVADAPEAADDDEFSSKKRPDAKPLPLRPHLGLSHVERAGMLALMVLLLAGGLLTYFYSIRRLPTESTRAGTGDFPIKGSMITVDSATTYWRIPISEGPKADTFRRGTELLPVLILKISDGRGAIRVLFRNDQRAVIGDAVTHTIEGAENLEIPATAGFDDIGMHAAYRTGGSKPWTIEVFEAASETASGKDFKRLFEINISTDRR